MSSSRNQRRRAARERHDRTQNNEVFKNSLTGLVDGLRMSSQLGLYTGGSTLSSYGTIAHSTNYTLMTLEYTMLTYFYANSGLFQTAIQLPVQDGIAKGIEIESDLLDPEDIDDLMDLWEEFDIWGLLLDAQTWARLYGGAAIIINTPQDPEKPLNLARLYGKPIEFYTADRWELTRDNEGLDSQALAQADYQGTEYYYYYGQKIHKTRVITLNGKTAPSRIRRQLTGWGMSEGERMIRDLNLYLKTQDVSYEIIDQAKLDIYKIKGFAQKLAQPGGTSVIQKRVELANELKNYMNALTMDADDDYDQKQLSFGGIAEIMSQNMVGVASALRMPMVKLFGLSPSGFNTGETDLLNYNQMVEGEVRTRLRRPIRDLLKILMFQKFGQEYAFRFDWPSMEQADAKKDEEIKTSQTSRLIMMYDRGLIDAKGFASESEQLGLVTTPLWTADLPDGDFPEPPNSEEGIEPAGMEPETFGNSLTKENSVKVYRNASKE